MVILGLGTNVGDRLQHLRSALDALKNTPQLTIQQVSPVYISDALLPENAPNHWDIPYLNCAIRCETSLEPHDLLALLKKIERQLGRKPEKTWGPRIIDIDLLAWDDRIQYDQQLHIPHEYLHERPFALWPLADVAPFWVYPLPGPWYGKTAIELAGQWGNRYHSDIPLHTKQIQQRIDMPRLMGIINLTPDSFSADGFVNEPDKVMEHISDGVKGGADIIDIGAEATGPKAQPIDAETEWLRLEPVLNTMMAQKKYFIIPPKISIDTRHASVASKALGLGVDIINDVSGLNQTDMRNVLKDSDSDIVFMHHLEIPENRNRFIPLTQNCVELIRAFALTRIHELESIGIKRERLIFDVGIGYGKTAEQSLMLIKQIALFHDLGIRLLVGHSRKSFLTQFTDRPAEERDIETMIVSQYLATQSIDILRVHNVDMTARAFKVAGALHC